MTNSRDLAGTTAQRMMWTISNMPLLAEIGEEFGVSLPFEGLRIGVSLHLEAKTAALLLALQLGGAEIVAAGNYGTTQDDIVTYLSAQGIDARGSGSDSLDTHLQHVKSVVDAGPDILLDNGADLVRIAIEQGLTVVGGTEETTSVTNILRGELAVDVDFPVIVINDSPLKALVENKHAVGQSVYESSAAHQSHAAGQAVPGGRLRRCGRGIALYARANGAEVQVAAVDEFKALEAALDGFRVGTVRGSSGPQRWSSRQRGSTASSEPRTWLRPPTECCSRNAGHFDREIDLAALDAVTAEVTALGNTIDRHLLQDDGRTIDLIAGPHDESRRPPSEGQHHRVDGYGVRPSGTIARTNRHSPCRAPPRCPAGAR